MDRGVEEPFIQTHEPERFSFFRGYRECCAELHGVCGPQRVTCEHRQRTPTHHEHIRHLIPCLDEFHEADEHATTLFSGELALPGTTLDGTCELDRGRRPRDDVGVLFQQ